MNMDLSQKIKKVLNNKSKILGNEGMSLLEVIVAAAIFSLIGIAMITLAVGGFNALQRGGDQTEAEALASEGIEAIRSIRDGAWNEVIYSQSAVEVSSGEWIFTGESTDETIGKYTRTITLENVCRDISDNITTCPGIYTDLHSKKVASKVTWAPMTGVVSSVQKVSYLTNWDSTEWIHDTIADFDTAPFGNYIDTTTSTSVGDLDGAIVLNQN